MHSEGCRVARCEAVATARLFRPVSSNQPVDGSGRLAMQGSATLAKASCRLLVVRHYMGSIGPYM